MVYKIISGGQTGADRGGLEAGRALGLRTGGTAPKGWRTDEGHDPSLRTFGLVEHELSSYPERTRQNVKDADATVVFGDASSPGSRLTFRLCRDYGRPVFHVPTERLTDEAMVADFQAWRVLHRIGVLNVAGNRERRNPGIGVAVQAFLVEALGGGRA